MDSFRRNLGSLSLEQAEGRAHIYVFELNLLVQLLAAHGIPVHLDIVERDEGWSQIVIRGPGADSDPGGTDLPGPSGT